MRKALAAFFLLKSLKGGGAYDLDPVILEPKLIINDNLRNGGNHNGKEEKR